MMNEESHMVTISFLMIYNIMYALYLLQEYVGSDDSVKVIGIYVCVYQC